MNPIVAARTALWEAQGSSRRNHAQAPPQRSEQCFPGTSGVRLRATAPEPFGMPRDGIGERIDTAFRSPSEAFFRRPAKPNDTSLPLLHQRSFDSRSGFYWSSAADSPKAVLPDLRKGGVQCQHIKSCKNDSRARSKKVPRSGRFEAKYAPCAAAVRRFRRLLQCIIQPPVRVPNDLKKASGPSKKRKKPSSQEGRGSSVTCKRLQQ